MPLYKYSEKDINGVVTRNVMEASSSEQLIKDRYKRGRYVYQIKQADDYIKRRMLKERALAEFAGEIFVLLSSGVPIVRALEIMASESGVPAKMKTMYANMVHLLQRGFSFAEALRLQGGAFPDLIISVLHSGEVSGKLSFAAEKMAVYYDKMNKIKQKIKSATAYPKFVSILTFVIVLFLFTIILPEFLDNTEISRESLPLITVIMMNISNFIRNQFILLLIFGGIIIYSIIYISRIPAFKLLKGRFLIGFPGISKHLKMIYTARFSTTLSNLYIGGVPLADALEISAKTIGNTYVEMEFEKSRKDIARGRPLSDAVRHMTGLSPRMYQVIAIGEETGKLGEVMESMGTSFDSEVDAAISRLIAVVSPVLLIVMTVIIALVMAGILLPLMTQYQNMY